MEASYQSSLRISNTTVTGAKCGVFSEHNTTIRESVITGNGIDVDCGPMLTCADISSWYEPSLDNVTTCDHSLVWDFGFPGTNWGICSAD